MQGGDVVFNCNATKEANTAKQVAGSISAARELRRSIQAQGVMAALGIVITWVVAGSWAGLSALIGAGAYLLPHAWFVRRLLRRMRGGHGGASAQLFAFFLGETYKLGTTLLLLGLIAYVGHAHIVWPALLVGLLCALKGYGWLFFLFRNSSK